MEFLTIQAQYEYAKHSLVTKQEERFTSAISYAQQFADKYPTSKYTHDAEQFKKESQRGIEDAKRLIAEAASNEKLSKKITKKDTVTSQPPSEKGNEKQKMPN